MQKHTNRKPLLLAVVLLLLAFTFVVGVTYALFQTNKKVGVDVESGKVEVGVTLNNVKTFSGMWNEGERRYDSIPTDINGIFYTSGTVTVDNTSQVLTLDRIVPMDKVTFDVVINNNSNVTVKYRTVFTVEEDNGLFKGLKITVNDNEFVGMAVDKWRVWDKTSNASETVKVTIELPEEAGNEYQGKTCKIAYDVQAVQGNANVHDLAYVTDNSGSVIGEYTDLQTAFDNATSGSVVNLSQDITVYKQITVLNNLDGITLDGHDFTIYSDTTDNPTLNGGSLLYFGNASENKYCTGVAVKNLNILGKARFGIFLCGGTVSDIENVNISGEYYYAVNLYGTHGANVKSCNISNSLDTGDNELGSAIWSNVYSDNPLNIENSIISGIGINAYKENNATEPKIFISGDSYVGKIVTYDDGTVSGNKKLCVSENSIDKVANFYSVAENCIYEDLKREGVYYIADKCGLKSFASEVNGGNDYLGKTVKLIADIDLYGETWQPIGQGVGNAFKGTFDGQNYTVKNLTSVKDSTLGTQYGNGMFGCVLGDAVIKNFTLDNAYIYDRVKGKGNIYGGICAYAYGNVTFDNVKVKNSKIEGFGKIGAILGSAQDRNGITTITNCSVDNVTLTGTYNVAPLIGLAINTVDIINCSVSDVTWNYSVRYGATSYITFATDKVVGDKIIGAGTYWVYKSGEEIYLYAGYSDKYNDYSLDENLVNFELDGVLYAGIDGSCHK